MKWSLLEQFSSQAGVEVDNNLRATTHRFYNLIQLNLFLMLNNLPQSKLPNFLLKKTTFAPKCNKTFFFPSKQEICLQNK